MPTVLRAGAFRVAIFLPPREHPPPHVHVFCGREQVVIDLSTTGGAPEIRTMSRLRAADVVRAFRLVEEHAEFLLERWREYHND